MNLWPKILSLSAGKNDNIMFVEERFMARCIELARHGLGYVAPNPMVGAVIVHNGTIVGEGFHRRCGEAHAEVNAIASVKDEAILRDSTIYVSLEPCSHYGKTPPCAELIIKKRIPKVVIGCLDPFPKVSGRGVRMLREAGIEVVTGVLEKECRELNKAFMTFQTKKRPYITLKWAESADGYMDSMRESVKVSPVVFSNAETSTRVHKLRAESTAILVGTKTALLDNPSLTVRNWAGKSPVRLVIDRIGKVPENYHLFDHSVLTIVFTEKRDEKKENIEFVPLNFDVAIVPQILQWMFERKLNSLMVEGGANLLQQFIDSGFWDEAIVEQSPMLLNKGVKSPSITSAEVGFERFGEHDFKVYLPQ